MNTSSLQFKSDVMLFSDEDHCPICRVVDKGELASHADLWKAVRLLDANLADSEQLVQLLLATIIERAPQPGYGHDQHWRAL